MHVALVCDLVNHVACMVLDHVRSCNHDDIMVCCSGCIWLHANKIAYIRLNQSQSVYLVVWRVATFLVKRKPVIATSISNIPVYILCMTTRLIQDVPTTMVPMGRILLSKHRTPPMPVSSDRGMHSGLQTCNPPPIN